MAGLQNIQPPLGMIFPALRSSGRQLSSFDTNETLLSNNLDTNATLLSNNLPSSENVIEALRKIRVNDNLIMVELTMPSVDAIRMQDLLPSRQPEIVFLQIKHHGTTPRTATTPFLERSESSELRWLREHQGEMARWRGQWLLIAEGELLAHNANFREIRAAIARNNLRSPFTYYVPAEDESPFTLL